MKELKIFALNATKEFGQKVASHLGHPLSKHEEYTFDDGECYVAPKAGIRENVRGCDVFVIQSIYGDDAESVDRKLLKLLIFMGALRDASADRITAVIPYYPYARQDRKTASRAPITTKYLARMLTSMWADRILSIDVHNPTAIQNAYSIPCDLLEANSLFARHALELVKSQPAELAIMSPDSGGLGRARKFREILARLLGRDVEIACLDKVHSNKEICGHKIMGDVRDRSVLIYDDMISSGKTVLECVRALRREGAKSIPAVFATHGLFVGDANENLSMEDLLAVAVTDTVSPFRLCREIKDHKLSIISTTGLFAESIKRIHHNESISDLLSSSGN